MKCYNPDSVKNAAHLYSACFFYFHCKLMILHVVRQVLLQRSNLKEDTKEEAEATVAILEKLPKPEPPNIKGR